MLIYTFWQYLRYPSVLFIVFLLLCFEIVMFNLFLATYVVVDFAVFYIVSKIVIIAEFFL